MPTKCVVKIDGNDVSGPIRQTLESLEITLKAGGTSDTCGIELDDRNGQIAWPSEGVPIAVQLGDENGVATLFVGNVDDVRSAGDRGGGVRMMITAKGFDAKGKARQSQERHWDNATAQTILQDAGQTAGITNVVIAPALQGVTLDYWAMQGESFIHNAQRLAREIGGTFKIAGTTAIIADRNGGTSASGQTLPSIDVTKGVNLISWELSPNINRNRYQAARARYYDPKTASWQEETGDVGDPGAEATHTRRHRSSNQKNAKIHVAGHVKHAKRAKGGGSITINGSLAPQPEAIVNLSGARPGVDGQWRIDAVFHKFDRSSGWTTRLDVKQPQGATGTDSRVKSTASSASTNQEAGTVSNSNVG